MKDSEKDNIKKELIEWIKQVDDSETLSMVKEVQEKYLKADSYSEIELGYIKDMLNKSNEDIQEGRVVGVEKLNDLFNKWRSEAS